MGPDTELISISKADYDEILKENTEQDKRAQEVSDMESQGFFKSNADMVKAIFRKPSEDRAESDLKFAVQHFKGVKFFAKFPLDIRKRLCKAMHFINAWSQTIIFEEGAVGNHFYIIVTGEVDVSIKALNRNKELVDTTVANLKAGESFGELALTGEGGVRKATVKSKTFVEVSGRGTGPADRSRHRTNVCSCWC